MSVLKIKREDGTWEAIGSGSNSSCLVPSPTESDYGKVLSATSEGLKWITPIGGSAPSAEGVEF